MGALILWEAQRVIQAKANGIERRRKQEENRKKSHKHKWWCRIQKICAGRQAECRIKKLRGEECNWKIVSDQVGKGDHYLARHVFDTLVRELDKDLGSAHDLFEERPKSLDALIEKRAQVQRIRIAINQTYYQEHPKEKHDWVSMN